MTKGGLYGRVFDATAGGQSAEMYNYTGGRMEDNKLIVPFAAFEVAILRLERANRRLIVVIALLIALLFGTNAAWLWYESQWETVPETTITQELETQDGGDAIINDGVHINGESQTDSDAE